MATNSPGAIVTSTPRSTWRVVNALWSAVASMPTPLVVTSMKILSSVSGPVVRPARAMAVPPHPPIQTSRAGIAGMPGQEPPLESPRGHIGEFAEQGVEEDAEHQHVGLQELAGVHGDVTDAGRGGNRFGDDQGQPHDAEGVAHTDQDRGQGTGQDHLTEELPGSEAVGRAHLD